MIEVEDLLVEFGIGEQVLRAVDRVSFAVAPGETFGLVGESGCGKSTILRALAGLNPDYEGRIRIAGREIAPKRDKAFFKLVQMVFQDPYGSLHPRQTVHAQLMEPVRIHGLDDGNGRIERVLAAVGLDPSFRFRYPHQLSGGQRQRVAVARTLILEPRVLLLDEPTSALDVSVQAEVLNLLADLREERGLTFLLVSHDLGVVAHMCDRLAVMSEGRIVEELEVGQLARGEARHPYTLTLLRASETYGEKPAAPAETFTSDRKQA
jgi:ABC-type dipeptide/oligopeptide/nickel transport system ATPase subunit